MGGSSFDSAAPPPWQVFQRVQEVESALRINVVRTAAVLIFYALHGFNYAWAGHAQAGAEGTEHHWKATAIAFVWLIVAAGVFAALRLRTLPPAAKFLTSLTDILLLTSAAAIGARAQSPLVPAYFLIIASTVLTFDWKLVVVATIASMVGYMTLVGLTDETWFDADHKVPVVQWTMTCASLGLIGCIGSQLCVGCRRGFLRAVEATSRGS